MSPYRISARASGRLPRALGLILLSIGAAGVCHAAPPLVPLPAPLFSFDRDSPTVLAGLVGAADLLLPSDPVPTIVVPGWKLGAGLPGDDLDGLMLATNDIPIGVPFTLLFSVDRQTVGVATPDPTLVFLGVPYNVLDQAARGHAAGDEYMGLQQFIRNGAALRADTRSFNSVLVRNNFDEGGTDLSAQPPTHASDYSGPTSQDNADSASAAPAAVRTDRTVPPVYFSLRSDSPSLHVLPGWQYPSGATIFYNPDPQNAAPTEVYATFYQLGLTPADDIDALLIVDGNHNGQFDAPDTVLFSLTRESPSLATIMGASSVAAAADVFEVSPGELPYALAPAAFFGLGQPFDNIDALDFALCNDPATCAASHGIRALRGDLNCDDRIDFGDINPFVLALSSPTGYAARFPHCDIIRGDINRDGLINFGDINPFVALLSHP
jgi:hypothetical protein